MSTKEKIIGIILMTAFFGIWLIQGLYANGHALPAFLEVIAW